METKLLHDQPHFISRLKTAVVSTLWIPEEGLYETIAFDPEKKRMLGIPEAPLSPIYSPDEATARDSHTDFVLANQIVKVPPVHEAVLQPLHPSTALRRWPIKRAMRHHQHAQIYRSSNTLRVVVHRAAAQEYEGIEQAAGEFLKFFYEEPVALFWSMRLGKTGATYLMIHEWRRLWRRLWALYGHVAPPLRAAIFVLPSNVSVWNTSQWEQWNTDSSNRFVLYTNQQGRGRLKRSESLAFILNSWPETLIIPYSFISRTGKTDSEQAELNELLQILIGEIGNIPYYPILVFDECSSLKSSNSARTRFVQRLPLELRRRVFLDGTPATNKVADLTEILQMLNPGLLRIRLQEGKGYANMVSMAKKKLADYTIKVDFRRERSPVWGSREAFTRDFVEVEGTGMQRKAIGGRNLDGATCTGCALSRCIGCPYAKLPYTKRQPHCRVCKRVVSEACKPSALPLCVTPLHNRMLAYSGLSRLAIEQTVPPGTFVHETELIQLEDKHAEAYMLLREGKSFFIEQLRRTNGDTFDNRSLLFNMIDEARRMAFDPLTWRWYFERRAGMAKDPNWIAAMEKAAKIINDESTKIKRLHDMITSEQDQNCKALVLTEWRWGAERIARALGSLNPIIIHGGLSDHEREANRRRFNEDDNCRAAVLTMSSCRGIELSANGTTRYVYVMSPTWQPGVAAQAIHRALNYERAHEEGYAITVLTLLGKDTVEPVLQEQLASKAFAVDHAVDAEGAPLSDTIGAHTLLELANAI